MNGQTLLTPEGLRKLKEELAECKSNRAAIADKIAKARELGDLSENAEYHQARDDQGFNEGRIMEIEAILKEAKIVDKRDNSLVGIGSKIKISNAIKQMEYNIVGATEADPAKGLISCESPLGLAFLGKKQGDEVEVKTPNGTIKYKIIDIN